jgi:hypothetical protein
MKYFPLCVYPFTRVNDFWINVDYINGETPQNGHQDVIIQGKPDDTQFFAEFYNNITLDVVTETVFNYPHPQITEKTLRPILHKRMFIIVGAPNILSTLHDMGFQTFPELIDESYDVITNPISRFNAIMVVIKKFCNMPLEDVLVYMESIEDRLENNFSLLKKLESIELDNI